MWHETELSFTPPMTAEATISPPHLLLLPPFCMYVCILQAGVQPTLDSYAEAFIAYVLTQEGRSQVDDVCECVHD